MLRAMRAWLVIALPALTAAAGPVAVTTVVAQLNVDCPEVCTISIHAGGCAGKGGQGAVRARARPARWLLNWGAAIPFELCLR